MKKTKTSLKKVMAVVLSVAMVMSAVFTSALFSVSANSNTVTDNFSAEQLDNTIWKNTAQTNTPTVENGELKLASSGAAFNNFTYFQPADRKDKLLKTVTYKVKFGEEQDTSLPNKAHSRLALIWLTESSTMGANSYYVAPFADKGFVAFNSYNKCNASNLSSTGIFQTYASGLPTGTWFNITVEYTYRENQIDFAVKCTCPDYKDATLKGTYTVSSSEYSKLTFGFSNAAVGALSCYIDDVTVNYYTDPAEDFKNAHTVLSKEDNLISWDTDKTELNNALADYNALETENETIKNLLITKFTAAYNNYSVPSSVKTMYDLKRYAESEKIYNIITDDLGSSVTQKTPTFKLITITDDFSDAEFSSFLWKTYSYKDVEADAACTAYVADDGEAQLTIPSIGTGTKNTSYKYLTTVNRALKNDTATLKRLKYTIDYSNAYSNVTVSRQMLSYNFDTYCVNGTNGVATGGDGAAAISVYGGGKEWAIFGNKNTICRDCDPSKPTTVTVDYDHSSLTENANGTYSGTLKFNITLNYTNTSGVNKEIVATRTSPITDLTLAQINAFGISAAGGSGKTLIDDVTVEYSYPTESLLETQTAFIDSVISSRTIDRGSEGYKDFAGEYAQNSAEDIQKLERDDRWNQFITAAKAAFSKGIDDDFEDKFYTDLKWEIVNVTKTGDYQSDTYVTATYGDDNSNTGIQPIKGTGSDYVLTAAKPDFNNVKYVSFDYIPKGYADSVRIYPFYADNSTSDEKYAIALQLETSGNSLSTVCFWLHSGEKLGHLDRYLFLYNNDTNMDRNDLAKYTNIAYNKPFKVIFKYDFNTPNEATITVTILDNDGNKLFSGSVTLQLTEDYSLENSYFAIRQNANGQNVIIDNVKTYSSEAAMNFNVEYANMLAYDEATLTPVQAADIKAMAADYDNVTDKANVNSNYTALAEAAANWTGDQAASFKVIHAAALTESSTDVQVQNAWRVLNALDASAKSQLKSERNILKTKLGNDKSTDDIIRVSFIGDSQTAQAAARNENYSDLLMNMIKDGNKANSYEYIRLGVSGIQLTTLTEGMSAHEKTSPYWQYNKIFSPDIIFLMIGTNDASNGKTDDNFTATLKRTVQLWQSLPSAPTVVLVSPYASDGYDNAKHQGEPALVANLPKVQAAMKKVQEETGCAFVDLYEYTNNWTTAEKEAAFKKDDADRGTKPEGYSDGKHPGSVGRTLAAEYIYNTFFKKTSVDFATDAIRSYDHSYADNYENYLGYSYYDLDEATKATVKNNFTDAQKNELIAASAPQFGLKATGLDVKSFPGANGQLVYHVKYDTSALDAFEKSYTYGMIAVPNKALANQSVLTHDSKINMTGINLLDIQGSGIPASNLYFRLLGSENLKGYKISARAYICVDGDYIYSDDTVTQSVNAERRAQASKMIDLSYKGLTKNGLSYTYDESVPYFENFAAAPTVDNIDALLGYVKAMNAESYAPTDDVYKFIKDNYTAYIAG